LLDPRSIAIVGVSVSDPRSWGYRVVRVLVDGGFRGQVTVIHPSNDFPGVPTHRSLADAPRPDLVAICVRAENVLEVVAQARRAGARAAVVFASDFAEAGQAGERLQASLREAAGDMPVLGPNCLGFSNRTADVKMSVAPFLNRPLLPPGPVALVAQSGALGLVLSRCVEEAGIGYSHFVSVGNEATLTGSRVALDLLGRDEVRIVLLYLEALRDPATLVAAATTARRLGKRIMLLHAGRSKAAQRATLSHTAAIADDATLLDALCRDTGIARLREDTDVRPAVAMARRGWRMPPRPRVAIFSNSGGAGAVLADRLTDIGARVEPLSDALRDAIRKIGSVRAGDSNPLDIGGGWEALLDRVPDTLALLEASDEIDAIVVYYAFGDLNEAAVAGLVDRCARSSKPCVFVWQAAPPAGIALVTSGEVLVTSIGDGVRFIASMMAADASPPAHRAPAAPPPVRAASDVPEIEGSGETVPELESGRILRALGVEVVETLFAAPDGVDALVEQALATPWERFVVKANARDVPHRSRAGLIALDVSRRSLHATLAGIADRLGRASRDPHHRLLVQPQLAFRAEIAVGGLIDPRFGPSIIVGPGGVHIESTNVGRTALLLDVANEAAVHRFLESAEQALGLPPSSLGPVVRAVEALLRGGAVAEIDINPMVIGERGTLVALDGLIVPGPRGRRGASSTTTHPSGETT
jgi:acyl-CoA synthetase (NDP forming)